MSVTLYDGTPLTLDQLLELCDCCDSCEQGFDELAGVGDLSTSPTVIRQLVEKIKGLEKNVDNP